jgi:hypothetical protein
MHKMTWFVRAAALYNISGALVFLVPGGLPLFGVSLPHSQFFVWLPALMALFASVVLLLSSADLEKYAAFPYWNGLVRMTFVIVTFALDFGGTAGKSVNYLAYGDVPLALVCIFGLPRVSKRTHLQLLTNN